MEREGLPEGRGRDILTVEDNYDINKVSQILLLCIGIDWWGVGHLCIIALLFRWSS